MLRMEVNQLSTRTAAGKTAPPIDDRSKRGLLLVRVPMSWLKGREE